MAGVVVLWTPIPRRAMNAAYTAANAVTIRAAMTELPDAAPLPITATETVTPTAAPTWQLMLIRPPGQSVATGK
jgi:hypothetical protein